MTYVNGIEILQPRGEKPGSGSCGGSLCYFPLLNVRKHTACGVGERRAAHMQ